MSESQTYTLNNITLNNSNIIHVYSVSIFPSPVPTSAPVDLIGASRDSTSIDVSWNDPPSSHQNGKIVGYSLMYSEVNGSHGVHRYLNTDGRKYTMKGLNKWKVYGISVAAFTRQGPGPYSDSILIRTDQDGTLLSFTHGRVVHGSDGIAGWAEPIGISLVDWGIFADQVT